MANAYLRDLHRARQQLAALLPKRAQLDAKIAWLQAETARLERLTGRPGDEQRVSLADVIRAVVEGGGVTAGLTDSCRRVLQAAQRPLRAHEVVLVLEHCGFSTSRYVDPLSAVTTVLHRLLERGHARVAAKTEGGWPLFTWVLRADGEKPRRSGARIRRSVRR